MDRRALMGGLGAGLIGSLATGLAGPGWAQGQAGGAAALAPIDERRLREHIRTLSSDYFEGRFPGSHGDMMATAYIAGAMAAMGLEPAGVGGSWFQPFNLMRFTADDAATLTVGSQVFRQLDDVVMISRKSDGSALSLASAPLVFAGYGVRAPEQGWDDYAGVDWAGKIAVVLVNDPDFEAAAGEAVAGRFSGRAMTWYGRWPYKYEAGALAGAAGVLIVHEDAPASYGWGVVRNSFARRFDFLREDRGAGLVTVEGWMQRRVAEALCSAAGRDFETLKRAARQPGFRPVDLGLTADVALSVSTQAVPTRNVAGMIRGQTAPQECVLLGAHHDHLGVGAPVDGDAIYNGAIDNASGVAATLEVARSFLSGPAPRRSIIFCAWAAEEQGLLGSEYYVNAPLRPLETTAAALTIDGLSHTGPASDMEIVGAGRNSLDREFEAVLAAQGRTMTPDRYPERGGFYRSDHFPFARAGVPALFPGGGTVLGQGGQAAADAAQRDWIERRYHKPQDEYDPNWNLAGALQDIAVVRDVMARIANSSAWPQWNPGNEFEAIRKRSDAARQ